MIIYQLLRNVSRRLAQFCKEVSELVGSRQNE